jgi:hypothetical protein
MRSAAVKPSTHLTDHQSEPINAGARLGSLATASSSDHINQASHQGERHGRLLIVVAALVPISCFTRPHPVGE